MRMNNSQAVILSDWEIFLGRKKSWSNILVTIHGQI